MALPLRTCVVDMNMVRPWKDPWGLYQRLWPWEAWAVLVDLCGRSRPAGPPWSSRDTHVDRVCHRSCPGDRRIWHPLHLVRVNGSFGCRTGAARTRGLILHTLPAFTFIYRPYLLVFRLFYRFLRNYYHSCRNYESCGDPDPGVGPERETPPERLSWSPAAILGCDRAPSWFALRRGVKRYREPHRH